MKLKTATLLAAICLSIGLVLNLFQWMLFSFHLLDFRDWEWFFRGLSLIQILLGGVPMIIFFLVLNAKQKG